MLKLKNLLIALFFISFTSCTDDLTEFDFTTTQTKTFNVTLNPGVVVLDETVIFNIDNADTNAYLEHLKNVKINKMTYHISNYVGEDNATTSFVAQYDGTPFHGLTNVNLKNANDSSTKFEVSDTNALNAIATKLLNRQNVNIKSIGSVTHNALVTFTVTITMELKITADAL
jgi:hypothetical protein